MPLGARTLNIASRSAALVWNPGRPPFRSTISGSLATASATRRAPCFSALAFQQIASRQTALLSLSAVVPSSPKSPGLDALCLGHALHAPAFGTSDASSRSQGALPSLRR